MRLPTVPIGRRFLPAWCPRARFEGELSLLSDPDWPGVEACGRCPHLEAQDETGVECRAPSVQLGPTGLCLEVDVYRKNGRKRRGFVALGAGLGARVRALMSLAPEGPGERPQLVDLKFCVGDPDQLEQEGDAFMERWRHYWNGEKWVRKQPGEGLHDWNKWGQNLEFMAVVEPGGLPPAGGWPPILDLPEGRYIFRVLHLRPAVGRRGEPELEWVFRVLGGPARGRRVFRRSPVRTPALAALVQKDLGVLLEATSVALPEPGPGWEEGIADLERRLKGIPVAGRVARRDNFLNLYLESRVRRWAPDSSAGLRRT